MAASMVVVATPVAPKRKAYRATSVFSNKRGKNSHEFLSVCEVQSNVSKALNKVLEQYGSHGKNVMLPEALRELNGLFKAPIFSVDGLPGAKAGLDSRLSAWRPSRPKTLRLILSAFAPDARLKDGTPVVVHVARRSKWSTRRACEFVLQNFAAEIRESEELTEEQRSDRHRAKLAMAFIATDAIQVVRMMATRMAKEEGKLDESEIVQHASDSSLGGSAGRGTGVVANELGRVYVECAIQAVRKMCD